MTTAIAKQNKVLVQMTIELDRNGGYEKMDVIGIVSHFIDRRYKEDADGNRGESRTIVDEVVDISAWDELVREVILTEKEKEYIADKLTNKFLGD